MSTRIETQIDDEYYLILAKLLAEFKVCGAPRQNAIKDKTNWDLSNQKLFIESAIRKANEDWKRKEDQLFDPITMNKENRGIILKKLDWDVSSFDSFFDSAMEKAKAEIEHENMPWWKKDFVIGVK